MIYDAARKIKNHRNAPYFVGMFIAKKWMAVAVDHNQRPICVNFTIMNHKA